eukprot:877859-Rhodomonas_salina.1
MAWRARRRTTRDDREENVRGTEKQPPFYQFTTAKIQHRTAPSQPARSSHVRLHTTTSPSSSSLTHVLSVLPRSRQSAYSVGRSWFVTGFNSTHLPPFA